VTSAPNILLVDDEPSVLRYTKTLLEIENYNVETANSGEEALQRMNRGPAPNLIAEGSLALSGGQAAIQLRFKAMPGRKILYDRTVCIADPDPARAANALTCSNQRESIWIETLPPKQRRQIVLEIVMRQ